MKDKEDIDSKEVIDSIMDSAYESVIEEDITSTNVLANVQSSTNNKYTPATILQAPPIRYRNSAVPMGQSDSETDAKKILPYPFESIFSDMMDTYITIDGIKSSIEAINPQAYLSDAKKEVSKDIAEDLDKMLKYYKKILKKIEELSL